MKIFDTNMKSNIHEYRLNDALYKTERTLAAA